MDHTRRHRAALDPTVRPSARRVAVTAAAVVAATFATMGIASAGHGAATLTGCLTAGGDLKHLAPGDAPAKDCGRNDTVVHMTDTDTTYHAGDGLALDDTTFSVHQVDWSQLTNVPSDLADGDDDTTYTGGSFALSGQSCPPGQIVTGIDSAGSLRCQWQASELSAGDYTVSVTPTGITATGPGGSVEIGGGGVTVNGAWVALGGTTGCQPVARVGDATNGASILQGSVRVLAC